MRVFIIYILNKISRVIYYLTPREFRLKKNIDSVQDLILRKNYNETFEYFEKYFRKSVLFFDKNSIQKYAIEKSLSNDTDKISFYLEFGVWKGASANYFSEYLKRLYVFDSFEGLKEDWTGHRLPKGYFDLKKKVPKLKKNITPVVGWVEDTLDKFLNEKKPEINFIHFDMDTYKSTKYTLEKVKPYLKKNSIILFDEFYNYFGWQDGEYKALQETFKEDEFTILAFNVNHSQAVIQIK